MTSHTTDYVLQRSREREYKNHKLAYDIWADTTKIADRQVMTTEELAKLISSYPSAESIRVRAYWLYGNGNKKLEGDYLIEQTANKTLNGPEDEPDFDEPMEDDDDDMPIDMPTTRKKSSSGLSLKLDSRNPMSWMLHEKSTQLDELKEKYAAMKARAEKLRDEKEKLERELIKKDHEIEIIQSESENTGGLNGFLSSDAGVKVVEILGPSLVQLLGGALGGAKNSGVLNEISEWVETISPEDQARVREIMVVIATKHRVQPEFLEALRNQMEMVRQSMEQNGTIISKVS